MSKKTIYITLRGMFYISLIFLIVDCATSKLKNTTKLDNDKGILVTTIHSNISGYKLTIRNKKSAIFLSANLKIDSKENFKVISLSNGAYYWCSMLFWKSIISKPIVLELGEEMDFNIEAGKINYVGDLNILVNQDGSDVNLLDIEIMDSTEVVLKKLHNEYPTLMKSYPFVKHLTNKPID